MKSPVHTLNSTLLPSIWLLLIFGLLFLVTACCQMMKTVLIYLKRLWSKEFTMILKNSHSHSNSETNEKTVNIIKPDFFQGWIKKKYLAFNTEYEEIIDEFVDKMRDLNYIPPDFRIAEFAFINDWLGGKISSAACYDIFKKMDLESVANTRVTRKFVNLMYGNEEMADYAKHAISQLKEKAVPAYREYLKFLRKYFENLNNIDDKQIPITWIEHILPDSADGQVKNNIHELTLNQFIYTMDCFIIGAVEKTYVLEKNVAVFDEVDSEARVIHWIFAPEAYITLLKDLYNIKEVMKAEKFELAYVSKLIESCTK